MKIKRAVVVNVNMSVKETFFTGGVLILFMKEECVHLEQFYGTSYRVDTYLIFSFKIRIKKKNRIRNPGHCSRNIGIKAKPNRLQQVKLRHSPGTTGRSSNNSGIRNPHVGSQSLDHRLRRSWNFHRLTSDTMLLENRRYIFIFLSKNLHFTYLPKIAVIGFSKTLLSQKK